MNNKTTRKQIAQQIANISSYELGMTDSAADKVEFAHVGNQTQLFITSREQGSIYVRISETGQIKIRSDREKYLVIREALQDAGYKKSIQQIV